MQNWLAGVKCFQSSSRQFFALLPATVTRFCCCFFFTLKLFDWRPNLFTCLILTNTHTLYLLYLLSLSLDGSTSGSCTCYRGQRLPVITELLFLIDLRTKEEHKLAKNVGTILLIWELFWNTKIEIMNKVNCDPDLALCADKKNSFPLWPLQLSVLWWYKKRLHSFQSACLLQTFGEMLVVTGKHVLETAKKSCLNVLLENYFDLNSTQKSEDCDWAVITCSLWHGAALFVSL